MPDVYICRNPECYSKPFRSIKPLDRCPSCGSSEIHVQKIDWLMRDGDGWELSPEQARKKETGG